MAKKNSRHRSKTYKLKSYEEYIPYRESNLTRILQDSLGGNTHTCLIATISPSEDCADETISTLKFADRAKQVMTKVRANNMEASNDKLVNKLQSEIRHLREVLNIRNKGNKHDLQSQVVSLKMENYKLREGLKQSINSMTVFNMNSLNKREIGLAINSPESYYGESNRRYDFSTDVTPVNSKVLSRSGCQSRSKRDAFEQTEPQLKPTSNQMKVTFHF